MFTWITVLLILVLVLNIYLYRCIDGTLEQRRNRKRADAKSDSIEEKHRENTYIYKLFNLYRNWTESYVRFFLLIVMYVPSHTIRKFLLRYLFGMRIGKKVTIYYGTEFRYPWKIEIGDGTIIGDKCILDGRYGIIIGKDVNFSTGVWIWTAQHAVDSTSFSTNSACGKVIIGDRAWVSCRAVVLPDISIEEGAVVAAGAVVTKNCDPFSIYGGVPAKKIGDRNRKLTYHFTGEHLHFL